VSSGTTERPRRLWPRLWWVPLLLALAPLGGKVPARLDIPGFFAPMRETTAAALAAREVPWLNPDNGCGEAWFANPETGVLYPPHLLYTVLPLTWGLSAEAALHLAWLSLGAGLLAAAWGARDRGRTVVEVAAWSCGPALSAVGVVNNLDTLAWVPWIILAAIGRGRKTVVLLAAVVAMAWLAGEPQIWALAVVMAVLAAPRRGAAVVGVLLGLAVVAVQAVPFAAWVLEGDRGHGLGEIVLAGAVDPRGWAGVVMPGVPTSGPGSRIYVASLFLGVPLALAVVLGAARRWRLAVPPLVLAGLATLPEVGGEQLYLALTQALVRYPSRFAVVALVCLIPLAGPGVESWLEGKGRWLALALGAATLVATAWAPTPLAILAGAAPALLVVAAALLPTRAGLRTAALVAGAAAAITVSWPLLGLRPVDELGRPERAWPEAGRAARVYAPAPNLAGALWISERAEHRGLWPAGYSNLRTGMRVAQSPAPVRHRDLADHLRRADEGSRRWLASLAAPWVILPTGAAPADLVPVSQREGLWLYRNPAAWSVVSMSADRPSPGAAWRGTGAVLTVEERPGGLRAAVISDRPGWLCLSMAPVSGWRWRLDGERVGPEPCGGILQALPLPAGAHVLEGRYRPPLLAAGASLSGAAVVALALLLASASRRPRGRR